ncbi:multidrug efflux protein [Candidatus Venteria ishoeyi]|uniref:Multidrug efflux protein n=3 Tax=Candidatus Venteria ishoeyi TaxID=1899563 RepID=A0A1H6FEH8_9GAMM|nr:multidrug efflux protein [Candidatus Venteria ishoeyi]
MLAFSHGLMKWVANKNINVDYMSTVLNYWFYIGLAISVYVLIFLYYLHVLKFVNIGSFYASYTGLSLVFVLLIGTFLFKEPINLSQVIGILLIVAGIFLVKPA